MTMSDVAKVMDTIMSIPGMNETVKMDFKISRKNVLLLYSVIEKGLASKDAGDMTGILEHISEDALKELKAFSEDCLNRAGLMELMEKLKTLGKNSK